MYRAGVAAKRHGMRSVSTRSLAARTPILAALIALAACDGGAKVLGPAADLSPSASLQETPPAPPPTLTGEILAGTASFRQIGDCRTDEHVTVYFAMSGVAAGPYTGRFVKAGRIRFAFEGDPGGPRVAIQPASGAFFDATFTIFSPLGTVTGRETDPALGSTNAIAACVDDGTVVITDATIAGFFILVSRYTATIWTRYGRFRDEGAVRVTSNGCDLRNEPGCGRRQFPLHQQFLSDHLATMPIPQDEEDSDHDG
jgi:hypothetical protein